jgi:hypothetical protein
MKPEKKWTRYTQLSDIWVNMSRYRQRISPRPNGCVEWTGAKHRQGYGMCVAIRDSDKKRIMTVTHRVAMRLKLGRAIDANEGITHICNNPLCVNPEHLAFKHETPSKPIELTYEPQTIQIPVQSND